MSDIATILHQAIPASQTHRRELVAGEVLFRRLDQPHGLFLLTHGAIQLVRWTANGERVAIHAARAGSTFAEASLFTSAYHCDAIARSRSIVTCFTKAAVLQALNQDPSFALAFSAHLALALRDARRLIELKSVTPLTERLHQGLTAHVGDDGKLAQGVSIKSVSEAIGATPEACYRALADLERAGRVLREGRGKVQIVP